MSQNKFMHPRNIYKKPPSFKEMAIKYPEFRKMAKQDLSGKITIDFKDPEALRALTCTLLEKDFGLKVHIPVNHLIPTLPLRLNYLLWIEDLLKVANINASEDSNISGIDIGTGASCIYPLLAAKQNEWTMLGTEIDLESAEIAKQNVDLNSLQDRITVKHVESSVMLKKVIGDREFTFSMCNPPFFSRESDLDYLEKSRSPARPPPRNGCTGDVKELIVSGGEVGFIRRMFEESKDLGTQVKIYTTMIGQKASLNVLKVELKLRGIASMVETRFCQGNTTRWGLAWTFDKEINLNQPAVFSPSQKKGCQPMTFVVPEVVSEHPYTVESVTSRVVDILKQLGIQHKIKKRNKFFTALQISALSNTWSHQRRRNRNAQFAAEQKSEEKSPESDTCASVPSQIAQQPVTQKLTEHPSKSRAMENRDETLEETCTYTDQKAPTNEIKHKAECNIEKYEAAEETCTHPDQQKEPANKRKHETECEVRKKLKTNEVAEYRAEGSQQPVPGPSRPPLATPVLQATAVVRRLSPEIHLELLWTGGSGGRDAMHQVLQYIKNKLK